MLAEQAQTSQKAINSELFSLNPSALITMFEIDTTDLAFDIGLINSTTSPEMQTIFRIHNAIGVSRGEIIWQNKKYVAIPIHAEGFDINTRGTLPTPTLSMSVEGQYAFLLNPLRYQLQLMDSLIGAKVTRIRTFAKFLDAENFIGLTVPDGFFPDPNAELPRDIYYVDRKSNENKYGIELQLASILDVEGVRLPLRAVVSNRCTWQYRGEGCCYEYAVRKTEVHGKASLPPMAPPVANDRNESIRELLQGAQIIERGLYNRDATYTQGESVYLEKNGIKYYFVCKMTNPPFGPPNLAYWIPDQCAKDVTACKLRWNAIGASHLRFGGFPAVNKAM